MSDTFRLATHKGFESRKVYVKGIKLQAISGIKNWAEKPKWIPLQYSFSPEIIFFVKIEFQNCFFKWYVYLCKRTISFNNKNLENKNKNQNYGRSKNGLRKTISPSRYPCW